MDVSFYVLKNDLTCSIAQANDLVFTKYEFLNFETISRYTMLYLKFQLHNFNIIFLWI